MSEWRTADAVYKVAITLVRPFVRCMIWSEVVGESGWGIAFRPKNWPQREELYLSTQSLRLYPRIAPKSLKAAFVFLPRQSEGYYFCSALLRCFRCRLWRRRRHSIFHYLSLRCYSFLCDWVQALLHDLHAAKALLTTRGSQTGSRSKSKLSIAWFILLWHIVRNTLFRCW